MIYNALRVQIDSSFIIHHFSFYLCAKQVLSMSFEIEEQSIDKFIMVGDRVLIKPKSPQDKTRTGLYLPPGLQEREALQSGYVLKVGPGYPIPAINEADEPWKDKSNEVKYVPLQPREGDMAVFLQKSGWEIEFNNEKYVIVPQNAILILIRDEGLFK
jgi:chaperonin GroES